MQMNPGLKTSGRVGADQPSEGLRWTVHPAKNRGWRLALASLSIPLFAAIAGLTTGSIAWGLFAGGLIFISLNRFFFPTVYVLGSTAVEARYPLRRVRRPWSDFSSIQVERNGIFLSPYSRPNRLENFRGLFLLMGQEREEAAEFIARRLEEVAS
ncbi:MAG: hypothetical protein O6952_03175 [Planctomycetota bacterium]|nr:hypothetical protein [Planctomycetota bacterium]